MPAAARKKIAIEDQPCIDGDAESTGFLKSEFTAIPNRFFKLIPELTNAELILALIIYRFTSGFLRFWLIMGEFKMLEATGLCRTSYYEARSGLIDKGLIEIRKSKIGRTGYRFKGAYQVLLHEAGSGQAADPLPVKSQKKPQNPEIRTSHYNNKEAKENKHQQQQTPILPEFEACDDDDFSSNNLSTKNDGESLTLPDESQPSTDFDSENKVPLESSGEKVSPQTEPKGKPAKTLQSNLLNPEQSDLVAKIRCVGVSAHIAARLVQEKPVELIRHALAGLAARHDSLKNPAGWFVQEVMAGGYEAPKAVQAAEQREKVAIKRATERETEQIARDIENAKALADWAEIQRLAPDKLKELVDAARAKLAQLSAKFAEAPEDSPMVRGAVLDLYRGQAAALQSTESTDTPAKAATYLPRGETAQQQWTELRRKDYDKPQGLIRVGNVLPFPFLE